MRTILVMIAILLAGDAVLFSSAYTIQGWHIVRSEFHQLIGYIETHTRLLPGS